MTPSDDILVLRRIPAFAGLSEVDARALHAILKPRLLVRGEAWCQENQKGDTLALLLAGRMGAWLGHGTPASLSVGELVPGAVVGEMACIDPGPRSATVLAMEDSRLLELNRAGLRLLQERVPRAAVALVGSVIRDVTARLREVNRLIEKEAALRGMPKEPRPSSTPSPLTRSAPPSSFGTRVELARLPLLAGFSPAERDSFARATTQRFVPAGGFLCREGTVGSSCFLMAQGEVEVWKRVSGEDQLLARLPEGAVVGQMALVDRSARSASIKAATPVVLLELGQAGFRELLQAASPPGIRFQEQVAIAGIRQLRIANERFSGVARSTSRPSPRPAVSPPPLTPQEKNTVAYLKAALREWDMSMEDLGRVDFVRQEKLPPSSLLRQRGGRTLL